LEEHFWPVVWSPPKYEIYKKDLEELSKEDMGEKKWEKETKMNLNDLGKSLLFITPLVGDIPTHRFFSKRRAKNLEQRMELEKIKTEFKESKNLGVYFPRTQESIEYQEKPIEYLEFMLY